MSNIEDVVSIIPDDAQTLLDHYGEVWENIAGPTDPQVWVPLAAMSSPNPIEYANWQLETNGPLTIQKLR